MSMCSFHATNPYNGAVGQCTNEATRTVIVALVEPPPALIFAGNGVGTEVCDEHGDKLVREYGALVPAVAESTRGAL